MVAQDWDTLADVHNISAKGEYGDMGYGSLRSYHGLLSGLCSELDPESAKKD